MNELISQLKEKILYLESTLKAQDEEFSSRLNNEQKSVVVQELEKEISSLKQKLERAKITHANQIKKLKQQVVEADDEVRRITGDAEVTQKNLKTTSEKLQTAETELENVSEQLETTEQEFQDLSEQLETTKKELKEKTSQVKVSTFGHSFMCIQFLLTTQ